MNLVQMLNLFALMMSSTAISEAVNGGIVYFPSEVEAVTAASNIYNPLSIREDREYMGAIYKADEGFRFTVSPGRKNVARVQISLPKEDFDDVVAFWHTHGGANSRHRYFSDTDTETVNKFGRPLYLADYTGYLKVFEPGDSVISPFNAERLGLAAVRGYATGTIVKDNQRRPVRIATRIESLRTAAFSAT